MSHYWVFLKATIIGSMSDSSVLPSSGAAPAESPAETADTIAERRSRKTRKRSKSKGKNKAGTAAPAVAPAALRKSASWCIAQLDSMVRTSVNAALARTQIESMTIRGYWVLEAIADGGDMAQTELSALLGMDRSDMVRLIDSLEAADLVARTRDAKDRRRQLIALTESGNTTRASLRRSLRRAERAAVADCSPEVRTLLASLADGSVDDLDVTAASETETAAEAEALAGATGSPESSSAAAEPIAPDLTAAEFATSEPAEPEPPASDKSETKSDTEVAETVVKQEPKRKKSKKKKGKKKKKGASK